LQAENQQQIELEWEGEGEAPTAGPVDTLFSIIGHIDVLEQLKDIYFEVACAVSNEVRKRILAKHPPPPGKPLICFITFLQSAFYRLVIRITPEQVADWWNLKQH